MTYKITLSNEVGPLDTGVAQTEREAALVAIRIIRDAVKLYPGDYISISEIDNDQLKMIRSRE